MSSSKCVSVSWTVSLLLVLIVAVFITTPAAHAVEGGSSHYTPGFYGDFGVAVAPEPGFYLRGDLYYYAADVGRERVVQYGEIRADLEVDATMLMVTGLTVTDKEVLGGRYAFGAYVPVLSSDLSADVVLGPLTTSISDGLTSIGDVGLIPVSLFWNAGNVHINAYEVITLPVGSYDENRDVNTGLNYWTYDTNVAITHLDPEKGREISVVLGYAYNAENHATDYQSGEELHVDYMLNQFLSETTAVGLHGFYYNQMTGDSGSGAILGDFEGEAAGFGPAVSWVSRIRGADVFFNAKWLHETHAENRLKGDHLFLNGTLAF